MFSPGCTKSAQGLQMTHFTTVYGSAPQTPKDRTDSKPQSPIDRNGPIDQLNPKM